MRIRAKIAQILTLMVGLTGGVRVEAEDADATARPGAGTSEPDATKSLDSAIVLDPTKVLELQVHRAGSGSLLPGSARHYGEAKRLLARGQPARALKVLAESRSNLLGDREALLRGDALLALGDRPGAKDAYLFAIEYAQVKAVSFAAARGLVAVLGQLKERTTQLVYIDALLREPSIANKSGLLLLRALTLEALKRDQEASIAASRILDDYPEGSVAAEAEKLLARLDDRGLQARPSPRRVDLIRIRRLIRSGAFSRAEVALKQMEKKRPDLLHAVLFERAEILRRERKKPEEYAVLLRMYELGLGKNDGAEILDRLARLALARDDHAQATRYFDEMKDRFPADARTQDAQYLSAWIPYNAGDLLAANSKMIEFANTYKRSSLRPEALWFAGWSAYLAARDGLARRAFDQLLEEYPTSSLSAGARYWTGRIRQRAGELSSARACYREVLAQAPLAYWSFWAMTRLEELGEKVVLDAPPAEDQPISIPEVIAMLGPERPVGIDRAIALREADLDETANEELAAAHAFFKRIRDTRGRTMVAEMLQTLGAHHLAFLMATTIAEDGGDLITGKPYAWRAWRLAYPRAFPKEVEKAAIAHEIDPFLILAIMRTESSFRVKARSPVGARGLMQIMPGTATQIGRSAKTGRLHAARFAAPESNIWLGAWYLANLLKRYSGQVPLAIGAYNAGPSAVDRWLRDNSGLELDSFIERVPYRETRRYIRRVLETYLVYQRLNGEPPLELATKVEAREVPKDAVGF